MQRYTSFREFYPHYLSEHANITCRRLHFAGSLLVIAVIVIALLAPLAGYGFAWVGHYFFEKNRPATFSHPVYSFIGDWAMFLDVLRRRVRI